MNPVSRIEFDCGISPVRSDRPTHFYVVKVAAFDTVMIDFLRYTSRIDRVCFLKCSAVNCELHIQGCIHFRILFILVSIAIGCSHVSPSRSNSVTTVQKSAIFNIDTRIPFNNLAILLQVHEFSFIKNNSRIPFKTVKCHIKLREVKSCSHMGYLHKNGRRIIFRNRRR